jgi:hydroxymethylpyrimidine/phosphomethylpyrimidine kinase
LPETFDVKPFFHKKRIFIAFSRFSTYYPLGHRSAEFCHRATVVRTVRLNNLTIHRERSVERLKTALTIAGSDSGGGAGIQADLKTFSAYGVYGMSIITSVTAQNTLGVLDIHDLPAPFVTRQLQAVFSDLPVDAVKTGMLSNAGIIRAVAAHLGESGSQHLVVDPVMVAKSGHRLLQSDAIQVLREKLLPLAAIITPNLPEAEVLTDLRITRTEDMRRAAALIRTMGPRHVLIKGGHLENQPVDVLYDGHQFTDLSAPRIETRQTHGTGCTLSAAIAAGLAKGMTVAKAVAVGKDYITRAIREAPGLGQGHGPLNHFVKPHLAVQEN